MHESLATIDGPSGVSPLEKSLLLSYKLEYLQSAESQRLSLLNRQMDLQKQLELMKSVEVVEAPVVSTEPVKPRRLMIVSVAGMLGLMVGIFAAFLKEGLERPA